MPKSEISGKSAAEEIRGKLRLIVFLTSFVVITLLAILLTYIYEPVGRHFSFLPNASIAVIMAIVVLLTVLSIVFSNVVSRQVVSSIERYSSNLSNLLEVTRDIREETYGDILLKKIMQSSMRLTGSEAGFILLMEGEELVFKVVSGDKEDELVGTSFAPDSGIGGWVMKNGKPLLIHDVNKDERFDGHLDARTGFKTRNMLAVPLITQSKTLGVIELLNKHEGRYGNRDLEIVSYLADQAAISIERARFYEDHRNYEIHFTDMLLDTIDRLMPEKAGHSRRVSRYSNIMARSIGMPDDRARRLYYAALLHDLGFIRIPQDSFREPSAYREHSKIGYEMLSPINAYEDIAPFVLYHHERYDGQGYPKGLQGAKIPLESRIIAIAEAFDAMVSDASYKPVLSFEEAVEELGREAGKQFDPVLIKHFLKNVTKEAIM